MTTSIADRIIQAEEELCQALDKISFQAPITHVYNPLIYARTPHEKFVRTYGGTTKKVLMMGMNPGPWGMAQTGVPFGEIPAVRDWMGISEAVSKPEDEHPKRPIEGFECAKSEVSGRRLWGLFAERYPKAGDFFAEHYVLNYCPLVFMEESGKNFTPDKLPVQQINQLHAACDEALATCLKIYQPEWLVGVGAYAESALARVKKAHDLPGTVGKVLHPSPASPAANRGWAEAATKQLVAQGIWES